MGQRGTYTRKIGLDRETNKMLLLKHIEDSSTEGCQLKELMQVLPSKTRGQVQYLLGLLRDEGKAHYMGYGTGAIWWPGLSPDVELVDVGEYETQDTAYGTPKVVTELQSIALQNAEGGTPNAENDEEIA